jgi:hypothetical protein
MELTYHLECRRRKPTEFPHHLEYRSRKPGTSRIIWNIGVESPELPASSGI